MEMYQYEPPSLPDDEDVSFPGEYDADISESLHALLQRMDRIEEESEKESKRTLFFCIVDLLLALAALALSVFQFFS